MNRVLRKRLLRDLKSNFPRYLALVLVIIMGMYIVVSIVGTADTIITGTAERAEKNRMEDGQFGVFMPLTDEQEAFTERAFFAGTYAWIKLLCFVSECAKRQHQHHKI